MHPNELIQRIVRRIPYQTEGERDELLAAVDLAFPLTPPEPDPVPDAAADDDRQEHAPDTGTPGVYLSDPGVSQPLFSDPGAA